MRYKEFSPNRVLEKCIRLFWNKGFASCSIKEIVSETGVNRFSLYEEFSNKEGILYASIDLYQKRYSLQKLTILDQEKSAIQTLSEFFTEFFEDVEGHPPGCYMIHISTEIADEDNMVKQKLDDYLADIENRIIHLILRERPFTTNANFLARQTLGLFCTAMSFCLIMNEKERLDYIQKGLNVILNLNNYAETA